MKNINIVVAGGREFTDYIFLTKVLDSIIEKLREKKYETITIVSGKAAGADTLGEDYAKVHNLPILECPATWRRPDGSFNKAAGYIRNEEMAKQSKLIIAFWDGKSKGTGHMIDLGHKYKRTVLTFKY